MRSLFNFRYTWSDKKYFLLKCHTIYRISFKYTIWEGPNAQYNLSITDIVFFTHFIFNKILSMCITEVMLDQIHQIWTTFNGFLQVSRHIHYNVQFNKVYMQAHLTEYISSRLAHLYPHVLSPWDTLTYMRVVLLVFPVASCSHHLLCLCCHHQTRPTPPDIQNIKVWHASYWQWHYR